MARRGPRHNPDSPNHRKRDAAAECSHDADTITRRAAGTGPRGGEGIGARPAWVGELFTRTYERQEDMWLPILFAPTETSQAAGRAYVERITARADRDTPVSDQSIAAQRAAIAAYGAAKDPSYTRLKGLELPVLVVNGTDDIVIPTINSYILQQFLPNAELILYPDANHGSHFQYPELFARHTRIFLDEESLHDGNLVESLASGAFGCRCAGAGDHVA